MTAYGTPENQDRAIEAGFDVYLTKPLDPLELGTAVAEAAHRIG
jgi:CheY-like chemotaxis protein